MSFSAAIHGSVLRLKKTRPANRFFVKVSSVAAIEYKIHMSNSQIRTQRAIVYHILHMSYIQYCPPEIRFEFVRLSY